LLLVPAVSAAVGPYRFIARGPKRRTDRFRYRIARLVAKALAPAAPEKVAPAAPVVPTVPTDEMRVAELAQPAAAPTKPDSHMRDKAATIAVRMVQQASELSELSQEARRRVETELALAVLEELAVSGELVGLVGLGLGPKARLN